ncbi:hypothetical protein BGY98DRAFT_1033070 [Russula aff. rugulosa BPL654]|nr:hypothetical protein BGY98DRAFT_1033070 [Russula aff. rugulosa BPL654]
MLGQWHQRNWIPNIRKIRPLHRCLAPPSRRALVLWHISFKWMTSTFSLTVARQTGVQNPRLPKMGEIIGSLGNYTSTVIIPKFALNALPRFRSSFPWRSSTFRFIPLRVLKKMVSATRRDIGGAEEQAAPSDEGDAHMRDPSHSTQDNQMEEDMLPQLHVPKLKYVAMTLLLKKFMTPPMPSTPCATISPHIFPDSVGIY